MSAVHTSQVTYTPRPGSKTEAAVQAMFDGPVPLAQLAAVMDVPTSSVSAQLGPAIRNAMVIRLVDQDGASHFALRSREVPEGFSAPDTKTPPPGEPAPREPYARRMADPADPFGQLAKNAAAKPAAAFPKVSDQARAPGLAFTSSIAPKGASTTKPPAAPATPPQDAASEFSAALLHTDELLIQVGPNMVRLNTGAQQHLCNFLSKISRLAP